MKDQDLARMKNELTALGVRVGAIEQKLSAGGDKAVAAAGSDYCTSGPVGEAGPPFVMEVGRKYRCRNGSAAMCIGPNSDSRYPWKVQNEKHGTWTVTNRGGFYGAMMLYPLDIVAYADEPAREPASDSETDSAWERYCREHIRMAELFRYANLSGSLTSEQHVHLSNCSKCRAAVNGFKDDPASEPASEKSLVKDFREICKDQGDDDEGISADTIKIFSAAATKQKDAEIERLKQRISLAEQAVRWWQGDSMRELTKLNNRRNEAKDALDVANDLVKQKDAEIAKLQSDLAAANARCDELSLRRTETIAMCDRITAERDSLATKVKDLEAELAKFVECDGLYIKKGGEA